MNAYEISVGLGFCIFALWIAAYILCWIGQWLWAWIDDSEVGRHNVLVGFLLGKLHGIEYKLNPELELVEDYGYILPTGKKAYFSELYVLRFWFFTSAIPTLCVLALDFLSATLTIASVVAVAYLARFSLRTKKKIDRHCNDKAAHCES